VAVTGATGFLGSHLTAALVELDAEVTVLVRGEVPSSPIVGAWLDRVHVVRGSVDDQGAVGALITDHRAQTVVHLAAQSQVNRAQADPVATFEANVAGTWSLLEVVRRSPEVTAVVTASSDKAYGAQPELLYGEDLPLLAVDPYGTSKACADLLARSYHRTYGVPVCVTRCGNFFGPGDGNWARLVPGTIRRLLQGDRPTIRSDGKMVRDYLYVVDGARAYLRLVEAMAEDPTVVGEAFNFSTETPMTVLDLVAALQAAAGTDLDLEIQATASNEVDRQLLSGAKARRVLGWAPTVSFADAIDATVGWYRSQLIEEAS
jgi:CDP-glucose 4,6-dehydratase